MFTLMDASLERCRLHLVLQFFIYSRLISLLIRYKFVYCSIKIFFNSLSVIGSILSTVFPMMH